MFNKSNLKIANALILACVIVSAKLKPEKTIFRISQEKFFRIKLPPAK